MADEAINVEIEKVAEPQEADAKVQVNDAAKSAPEDEALKDLQSQFDTLKAETERERADKAMALQRANDAEAARRRAEQERDATKTEVTESRLDTVQQGIEAAKNEADAAESAYAEAQEKGDWKKAAAEQRKLAKAEARVAQLEVAKTDLEIAKTRTPQQEQPRRAPTAEEATDTFISQQKPAVADWLRNHRDEARVLATGSDPRRVAKINSAHLSAIADGLDEGSPEYFSHVEKQLSPKQEPPKPQQRKSQSAPVAPVQNGGGGTNGGGQTVTLTAAEARSATDGTLVWNYDDPTGQKRWKKGDVLGIQEMARRKLDGLKRGAYDPMGIQ